MTVEPQYPVTVFLGPSLPLEVASSILEARYLPPAQFGDIYRLIGSGVQTIVLIDGVFHSRASVWQRELLCAMQNGICVLGASSMGALRAAELHAHGMVGIGTVFQWYATGELDGDDEVALLHAGPELQYRPLTLPLVNVRFSLGEATARGLLEREQAAALLAALKARPFWERTTDALREALGVQALDAPRRARLQTFLEHEAVDLKRQDAIQALTGLSGRRDEPHLPRDSSPPASLPRLANTSHHDRFRLLKRGFPRSAGPPVDGEALAARVLTDSARRRLIQWSLGARFFAREWALDRGVGPPAGEASAIAAAIHEMAGGATSSPGAWLRANAIGTAEHAELLARTILESWVLGRPPEQFGLSSRLQDEALLPELPEVESLQPACSRAAVARALPFVAAWCLDAGAAPGPEATAALAEQWRGALASLAERGGQSSCEPFLHAIWALERGPVHFGHATWSLEVEVLCQLQMTGGAARLANRWEGDGA